MILDPWGWLPFPGERDLPFAEFPLPLALLGGTWVGHSKFMAPPLQQLDSYLDLPRCLVLLEWDGSNVPYGPYGGDIP